MMLAGFCNLFLNFRYVTSDTVTSDTTKLAIQVNILLHQNIPVYYPYWVNFAYIVGFITLLSVTPGDKLLVLKVSDVTV